MNFWQDTPPTWTPTDAEYYNGDRVGSGALATFMASRRRFEAEYVTGTIEKPDPTEAQQLGSMVDTLLTEPEGTFDRRFTLSDRKESKRDQKIRLEAAKWHGRLTAAKCHRSVVAGDLYLRAQQIVRVLLERDHTAKKLAAPGLFQPCFQWDKYGVPLRGKPDKVMEWDEDAVPDAVPVELSIKVLRKATTEHIRRELGRRPAGLISQPALYELGWQNLWGIARPGQILIVVESSPPFDTWCEQIPDSFMALGRHRVDKAIRELGECIATGDWRNPQEKRNEDAKTMGSCEPAPWMLKEIEG